MALFFIGKMMLLLVATAAAEMTTDDELHLVQVALQAKTKKLNKEAEMQRASAAPSSMPSCPSDSAFLTGDAECGSAAEFASKMKFAPTSTQDSSADKVDLEVLKAKLQFAKASLMSLAAEEASVVTPHFQDTFIVVVRYLLNLVTLVAFLDTLRRLCSHMCGNDSKTTQKVLDDSSLQVNAEDQLHKAAMHGTAVVVERLLQQGAAIDALDDWEETPLHQAARSGAIPVCELLLAHGAQLDAKNAQKWTPLVAAASNGKKACCEWLLSQGATPGDLDKAFFPPLLLNLLKTEEEPVEPAIATLAQVDPEADLVRRILEPKPEWEEPEKMPDWDLDDDEDFAPTAAFD